MKMAQPTSPGLDQLATVQVGRINGAIDMDDARRRCMDGLLDRAFCTIPPVSYGSRAYNLMDGLVGDRLKESQGALPLFSSIGRALIDPPV